MMINIYSLINPINDQIFYVGATKHPLQKRLRQHIGGKMVGETPKNMLIRDIISSGRSVEICLLEMCEEKDARRIEDFYITIFTFYGLNLLQSENSNFGTPQQNIHPSYFQIKNKTTVSHGIKWDEDGITREVRVVKKIGDDPIGVRSYLYSKYLKKRKFQELTKK